MLIPNLPSRLAVGTVRPENRSLLAGLEVMEVLHPCG